MPQYIVYIPRLNPLTFLHANGQNNQAFRVRDYSRGPGVAPLTILEQTSEYGYDDLLREAVHAVERPGNAVTDSSFWHSFIQEANRDFSIGSERVIGQAPPAPPVPRPPVKRQPVSSTIPGRVVPRTPMRHLYGILEDFASRECHLALATEAARVPSRLAKRFCDSVDCFSGYENAGEPFVPPNAPRKDLPAREKIRQIASTTELTSLLVGQCQGVGSVENDQSLSFRFLEREVIPGRTTGKAVYDDGASAQRGAQLDWLLVNINDRTPIVAEIKVREDKDAFYALIQLLMYAAELVTPSQQSRLATHYPYCCVIGNCVDLYLVLSGFNERSDIQRQIFSTTRELCTSLIPEPGVAKYVRRLACLDGNLSEDGELSFRCLYRCDRP